MEFSFVSFWLVCNCLSFWALVGGHRYFLQITSNHLPLVSLGFMYLIFSYFVPCLSIIGRRPFNQLRINIDCSDRQLFYSVCARVCVLMQPLSPKNSFTLFSRSWELSNPLVMVSPSCVPWSRMLAQLDLLRCVCSRVSGCFFPGTVLDLRYGLPAGKPQLRHFPLPLLLPPSCGCVIIVCVSYVFCLIKCTFMNGTMSLVLRV